eukprot:763056-Hanusia_phi.AAC.7
MEAVDDQDHDELNASWDSAHSPEPGSTATTADGVVHDCVFEEFMSADWRDESFGTNDLYLKNTRLPRLLMLPWTNFPRQQFSRAARAFRRRVFFGILKDNESQAQAVWQEHLYSKLTIKNEQNCREKPDIILLLGKGADTLIIPYRGKPKFLPLAIFISIHSLDNEILGYLSKDGFVERIEKEVDFSYLFTRKHIQFPTVLMLMTRSEAPDWFLILSRIFFGALRFTFVDINQCKVLKRLIKSVPPIDYHESRLVVFYHPLKICTEAYHGPADLSLFVEFLSQAVSKVEENRQSYHNPDLKFLSSEQNIHFCKELDLKAIHTVLERYRDSIAKRVQSREQEIMNALEEYKTQRNVPKILFQGIPPSLRGSAWMVAIGNKKGIDISDFCTYDARARDLNSELDMQKKREMQSLLVDGREKPAGESAAPVYENKDLSQSQSDSILTNFIQVRLDLIRTLPRLRVFSEGGSYTENLRRVLEAFVLYDPGMGYVQGMGSIAGILLLHTSLEETFVSFINILENQLFQNLFHMNMGRIHSYLMAFKVFLAKSLPKVYAHINKLKIDLKLFLLEWWMTLFTSFLRFDTVCHLWDILFFEGIGSLVSISIAILKSISTKLLDADFEGLLFILTHMESMELDPDKILQFSREIPRISSQDFQELADRMFDELEKKQHSSGFEHSAELDDSRIIGRDLMGRFGQRVRVTSGIPCQGPGTVTQVHHGSTAMVVWDTGVRTLLPALRLVR